MKSRGPHHRPKRDRWSHCNTPDALRRRRAAADARREAMAATLPPIPPQPEPLSMWQTVLVLDAHGHEAHRIELRVPVHGCRCDQHAGEVDGERRLVTATQVGRIVAGWVAKRPSRDVMAERRRRLAGG